MVRPLVSAKNLEDVKIFSTETYLGRLLVELRDVWKFSIGDVLVRQAVYDGSSSLDLVSIACPVPKKFKVVHIDDLGMPWVKQLSVKGGFGTRFSPLAETWSYGEYRFSVDPEQIDSILLGYKYDPRIEYKQLRKKGSKHDKTKT